MNVVLAFLAAQLRLIVAACGLALVAYGFALAWLPLAFIVPGAALVAAPVVGAVVEARAVREAIDRRLQRAAPGPNVRV